MRPLYYANSVSSLFLQWLSDGLTEATQYEQAENGKTELSLLHFSVSYSTSPNIQGKQELNQ